MWLRLSRTAFVAVIVAGAHLAGASAVASPFGSTDLRGVLHTLPEYLPSVPSVVTEIERRADERATYAVPLGELPHIQLPARKEPPGR